MFENWKIGCLLVCLFFLIKGEGFAQYKFDNANHISKEDGLPSNHTQVIKQCENGFIWIGTREGLCRYDGSQIRVYRREKGKSISVNGENG